MKNSFEHKPISLELKDLDNTKRTAVIAHAVYNNIDRVKDISVKGMFDKTWKENKSIDFLFNHNADQITGSVVRTFDDEEKAYTEVKFGNWTLGNDVLEMADMGVLKGASFGYITEKKDYTTVKGQKVRKLLEVKHIETSLLTKLPANPLAGIVQINKAFEELPEFKSLTADEQNQLKAILTNDQSALIQLVSLSANLDVTSDLYTWINYNISQRASLIGDIRCQLKYNSDDINNMKSYVSNMEKFVYSAKASDESIISIQNEIKEVKQILSKYDTAITQPITEPVASKNGNDMLLKQLLILHTKIHS